MNIRVIANAHAMGGGELSVCTIMRMLVKDGHHVEFHPTAEVHQEVPIPPEVARGPEFSAAEKTGCDVLFFYANNFIDQVPKCEDQWKRFFAGADRRVMCLNCDISHAVVPWFRNAWHKVIFQNTTKLRQFPAGDIRTVSLPPPVDPKPFLSIRPDYTKINLIRHSIISKYCDESVRLVVRAEELLPEAHFWFMGTPPGIALAFADHPRFHLLDAFALPVPEFLENGSLFWYRLGPRMHDQGPRVIVEAMAAGLPCIVDDRDGAADRITPESGWKCRDNDDYCRVLLSIQKDTSVLAGKGSNARRRVLECFDPRQWLDHILRD